MAKMVLLVLFSSHISAPMNTEIAAAHLARETELLHQEADAIPAFLIIYFMANPLFRQPVRQGSLYQTKKQKACLLRRMLRIC